MLCHDDGVNVYPKGGHEVEGAEDHVGQLDGDPLRLARALFLSSGVRVAHVIANLVKSAILRRESTRSVDERISVPVFLESLGQLGMDQAKSLRERGRLFPPPMFDRVLVDFLCKLVDIHSVISFPGSSFPNFTHLQGHKRPIIQSVVFDAVPVSEASIHT